MKSRRKGRRSRTKVEQKITKKLKSKQGDGKVERVKQATIAKFKLEDS